MTKSAEKGILLIISGPAGTGKGTVVNRLVAQSNEFALSISATTRPPRPGETDGIQYYFISKDTFKEKIQKGEMLEYAEYVDNYYGTPKDRITELLNQGINVILEIEVIGAMKVKALMPEAVTVLLLPPSFQTLENRLRGRNTNTEEDICRRLKKAREEISRFNDYDYVVINEDDAVDKAVHKIISIIEAEKQTTRRNPHIPERMMNI